MIKGKGFRGALRYNMDKVAKGVAEVLDHSFVEVSEKSIMKEVQMVKVMRPNLQKFFYHTSINFPPTEDLSNATMIQIGHDYLRDSGFSQHQYIMFRHHDATHPHLHILVNRIGYDGKVLSDSNDFVRCEEILRRLEKKYNLAEVPSSRQARERAVTKNEMEMMKRTNDLSIKLWLQTTINKVLKDNPRMSTQEFIGALEKKGINVLFNQASTGYVSGISYGYSGFLITGSKLGNDFKWTAIRTAIDHDQERDRVLIQRANNQTRAVKSRPPYRHGSPMPGIKPIDGRVIGIIPVAGPDLGSCVLSLLDGIADNSRGAERDAYPISAPLTKSSRKRRRKRRRL